MVILNGAPRLPFYLRRGLRQGDPLYPFMFLLAIEPLQCIFTRATQGRCPQAYHTQIGLYTDDDALFLNPCKLEMKAIQSIILAFGEIFGLFTPYPIALQ